MTERHHLLYELVVEGEIDQLLAIVSLDEIATAWCSNHRRPHDPLQHEDDPDWWAVNLLWSSELFGRGDLYRQLLLKLVEHAHDEETLLSIGAGPLENFVSDDEDDLRWLEQECAISAGLRTALSGVWCASHVSASTLSRLDHAAGVALARPLPREAWPPEVLAYDAAQQRLHTLAGPEWYLLEDDEMTPEIEAAKGEYLRAVDELAARHARDLGESAPG